MSVLLFLVATRALSAVSHKVPHNKSLSSEPDDSLIDALLIENRLPLTRSKTTPPHDSTMPLNYELTSHTSQAESTDQAQTSDLPSVGQHDAAQDLLSSSEDEGFSPTSFTEHTITMVTDQVRKMDTRYAVHNNIVNFILLPFF